MTQLTETIYTVTVPKDAKDFQVTTEHNETMLTCWNAENLHWRGYVIEPNGDYSILGTVTSESIDFDVSAIVGSGTGVYGSWFFKDYSNQKAFCRNASDSFRSLLSSKDVVLRENEKLVIIQKR